MTPSVLLISTRLAVVGVLLLFVSGCGEATGDVSARSVTSTLPGGPSNRVLRLASTTSVRDSGLCDVLLPVFERAHQCRVDLIAVGTGAALKLGEAGDVDALLCHARESELQFMQAGFGVRHEPIMHNFYLIAGPAADPANIKNVGAVNAFAKLASSGQRFVSRGDNSGTHQREQTLCKLAQLVDGWSGHVQAGQGMGRTLQIADEMDAYVLVDAATWNRHSKNLRLVPLVTSDDALRNQYAALAVNPKTHGRVNAALADRFVEFLISDEAQKLIADYSVAGRQLFVPDRLHGQSVLQQPGDTEPVE